MRPSALAAALFALLASPALAGPPYVTDDPEPTDPGHWEIYNFASMTTLPGQTTGQAGFDINYGAYRDLQLTAVIPLDYSSPGPTGIGDIELAGKYKFLHQASGSLTPDVAFFPRLFVPTGPREGPARLGLFLPIWAQKDAGPWSVFGGGGYDLNPGRGNRDFWLSGVAVTRTVTQRLTLGAEVFRQTADVVGGRALTAINLGATYQLTKHWAAMLTAGPGVENARQAGEADGYFAFYFTY